MLASDGLQSVAEEDIASILDKASHLESREIATALIDAVTDAGDPEQDNTSVVVIRVYQPEARPEDVPAPMAAPRAAAAVDLGGAWRDLRTPGPSGHRNGETGRLTHDDGRSRYPVHARAAPGASCLGCPDAGCGRELLGVLPRPLRRPARVAILGQSAPEVTGVLRAMLGEGLVTVLPDGPAIELSFGEAVQHTATFEDGSSLSQEGYPTDNLMRHGPLFLQIEAPLPMLATMSFLALELGEDADTYVPALRWAAKRSEIAILCAEGFGDAEGRAVGRGAPTGSRTIAIS